MALPAAILKSLLAALPLLSYLDAKYLLSHDLCLIRSFLTSTLEQAIYEKRDRLSPFYLIEDLALSPNAALRDRPLLIYEGTTWSYKAAHDMILRYATWLKERYAIAKGDIVALDFTNKPALIWVWYGLWAIGAKPAMINYNLSGERLVHCVRTSTARLVLVDGEVRGVLEGEEGERTRRMLETEGGERQVVVFDEATERVVETWKAVRPGDEERGGQKLPDMAMLIYTSGTTGMPKPAIISFQKLHFGAGFASRYIGLKSTDVYYTCMPLYHSSAVLLGLTNVLYARATLSLGHKFSTKTFWRDVRDSHATVIQYVGETCRYLLSAPPQPTDTQHAVRMAFGNGLRPDIWPAFKDRFNIPVIAEFYASTEGSSGSWNYQEGSFGVGAIGRSGALLHALMGRSARTVRMDASGDTPLRDPTTGFAIECPPGEAGELLWRLDPNNVKKNFQGYFGNGKATDEKILRDVFAKGDAWFRTGDLQRTSVDGLFWYFVDRIGDTYRWKSENVSTAEVAEVLGGCGEVAEANVYGVELPGHDGRAGCACVVLREGAYVGPKGAEVKEEVMRVLGQHVVKGLPRFAVPLFVRVTREMVTTGNLKHVKHDLRVQGVDPEMVEGGGDRLWWLKDGVYVRFTKKDWEGIRAGKVKL
ncbi:uncharacterized protein LAJ45_03361 [Morchella importuna]|uniref:Very long-chain fatty acid transport protein n=1 Tax=Morchella conica CCBAS932 TaxID=1392247 RepID=A0A3N4KT17_9PEZI|nr:uncharacterized protein LAJ45_03361 [Morchella importuna]KAH8152521.1 hypothetical protein LAJ45_03361 [Morchella importuna]RPB13693.1 putative long-chain fatty acid transporter [Morchella conica CCBAS932]